MKSSGSDSLVMFSIVLIMKNAKVDDRRIVTHTVVGEDKELNALKREADSIISGIAHIMTILRADVAIPAWGLLNAVFFSIELTMSDMGSRTIQTNTKMSLTLWSSPATDKTPTTKSGFVNITSTYCAISE